MTTAPAAPGGPTREVDVLVIGGGPAGSTAATLLAEAGRRVLVVDRERFPHFHIGESLLPYSVRLFERLGVWQRMLDHGFQRKWGAHFLFEPGMEEVRLDFTRGLDREYPMALQVRRAELDHMLLGRSREAGAEVLEGTAVTRVLFAGERAVGAELRGEAGAFTVRARMVLDASGRDTVLGKQLGLKRRDKELSQAALFAHYDGALMGLGPDGGDILVVGGPYGWFWLIPLDAETTSVGLVFPGRVMRERRGRDLETFFDDVVASSPTLSRRLAPARRISPVRPAADFSYRCSRLAGDGWALIGDAACFLDPVFSSGVHVALHTGEKAADCVARALARRGGVEHRDLVPYERFALGGLDRFRRYILAYYDPGASSLFRTPPPALFAAATVSAFAGKVFRRDPRVWLFDQLFFRRAAKRNRRSAAGKITLPLAPAGDVAPGDAGWVDDHPAMTRAVPET